MSKSTPTNVCRLITESEFVHLKEALGGKMTCDVMSSDIRSPVTGNEFSKPSFR